MDSRYKKILENNRSLLAQNIIQSEVFLQRLRQDSVLTDTMVQDMMSYDSVHERNDRLVTLLSLRGNRAFTRFRYILHQTGHTLLADFLHHEDRACHQFLTASQLKKRLPEICSELREEQTKQLAIFIDSFIKGEVSCRTWDAEIDYNKTTDIRRDAYLREKDYSSLIQAKDKEMTALHAKLLQSEEEFLAKTEELHRIQHQHNKQQQCHLVQLSAQSQFNAANNKSNITLTDHLNKLQSEMDSQTFKISKFLNDEFGNDWKDEVTDCYYGEKVPLNILVDNVLSRLTLCRNQVKKFEMDYNVEKLDVMTLLHIEKKESSEETVNEIVSKFAKRLEKDQSTLHLEIHIVNELLTGKLLEANFSSACTHEQKHREAKHCLKNIREEVTHLRKKMDYDHERITGLEDEISQLQPGWKRSSPSKHPLVKGLLSRTHPTALNEGNALDRRSSHYSPGLRKSSANGKSSETQLGRLRRVTDTTPKLVNERNPSLGQRSKTNH